MGRGVHEKVHVCESISVKNGASRTPLAVESMRGVRSIEWSGLCVMDRARVCTR